MAHRVQKGVYFWIFRCYKQLLLNIYCFALRSCSMRKGSNGEKKANLKKKGQKQWPIMLGNVEKLCEPLLACLDVSPSPLRCNMIF